jgi:hypothetical protein
MIDKTILPNLLLGLLHCSGCGNSTLGNLALIWARDDCDPPRPPAMFQQVRPEELQLPPSVILIPAPSPTIVQVPVPVPVPTPVPVPVPTPVSDGAWSWGL